VRISTVGRRLVADADLRDAQVPREAHTWASRLGVSPQPEGRISGSVCLRGAFGVDEATAARGGSTGDVVCDAGRRLAAEASGDRVEMTHVSPPTVRGEKPDGLVCTEPPTDKRRMRL
jgi:hypothetical protein